MMHATKGAGEPASRESARPYPDFAALTNTRRCGLMPPDRTVWIGFGCRLKRKSLYVDPTALPSEVSCKGVAGLDVVLGFDGLLVKFWPLYQFCQSLLAANPRRLLLIDLYFRRTAHLKLGGR